MPSKPNTEETKEDAAVPNSSSSEHKAKEKVEEKEKQEKGAEGKALEKKVEVKVNVAALKEGLKKRREWTSALFFDDKGEVLTSTFEPSQEEIK